MKSKGTKKVELYWLDTIETWSLNIHGHKCLKRCFFNFPNNFFLDIDEYGDVSFFYNDNTKAELITLNKYPYICTNEENIRLLPTTELDTDVEIKKIREQTGMPKCDFSRELCIPIRTLEDWENGSRKPPVYIVKLLQFWADNYNK